jgi:site-specific recombinase XerD
MNQYDSNVQNVMDFLVEHNYSPSHISLHKVCYGEFRAFLVVADQKYSAEQTVKWLSYNKFKWSKRRYLGYTHCLEQLEDIYKSNEIQLEHLSSQHSAYKYLMPSLKFELDAYLEYCKSTNILEYIDEKRIRCSRFLLYLQEHNVYSVSEISYTLMISFHREDFHRTQKTKDVYEDCIRYLLRYYAHIGKCSIGYSLILNKLLIHQVISLSDMSSKHMHEVALLRDKSLEFSSTSFWSACLEFQRVIVNYKYADTMRTFLFLDMHNLGYIPKLSWIWYEEIKHLLGTNWKMSRRILKLFEQFTNDGNITPKKTYTYKPTGFDQLPDCFREPLSSFLKLKVRENMCKSTVSMYQSANTRFCFFLVNNGVTSFDKITPNHLKEFNLMDAHKTMEGKNAYNVRIRAFLIYLEEQEIIQKFMMHLALPTVFAPKERVVNILSNDDIQQVIEYKENSNTPLELRNIAVILLGLRMGLRGSDIVDLQFSNIDWKRFAINIIQKKTKTEVTLPMPTDVGNAIYRYLMEGRPNSESSYIFIGHKAPYEKLERSSCFKAIREVLPERKVPGSGFHVTRRSFATSLLRHGTSINIITDSLGHRSDSTVAKYLSLDEERMRTCPLSLSEVNIILKGGL